MDLSKSVCDWDGVGCDNNFVDSLQLVFIYYFILFYFILFYFIILLLF